MTARTLLLLLGLALLWPSAAPAADPRDHTRAGGYQNMLDERADWDTPYPKREGVPIVPYPNGLRFNPSTVATYGLCNWSLWIRDRRPDRLRNARRAAAWLLRNQRRDGTWGYAFAYLPYGATETLPAGWSSALAQGQAMSLLGRLYRHTGRSDYLQAARAAVRPLAKDVADGGLGRTIRGARLFEEYPTRTEYNAVLNGDAQALLGLYDVADLIPRAQRLLDAGARGLSLLMPRFDSGKGYSHYSLVNGNAPPGSYRKLIDLELRILSRVTGRKRFARYADLWVGTIPQDGKDLLGAHRITQP